MNLRLIGLGTGVVLLASTLGACDAQQQDPQCVVARAVSDGSPALRHHLHAGPGQDATAACAQLKPERVGLQKYFSQEPTAKDSVAIRVDRVGVSSRRPRGVRRNSCWTRTPRTSPPPWAR